MGFPLFDLNGFAIQLHKILLRVDEILHACRSFEDLHLQWPILVMCMRKLHSFFKKILYHCNDNEDEDENENSDDDDDNDDVDVDTDGDDDDDDDDVDVHADDAAAAADDDDVDVDADDDDDDDDDDDESSKILSLLECDDIQITFLYRTKSNQQRK